jgi:hypothetical protein
MKNLVKILILSVLSYAGFAQSKMDMQANSITINRPLKIEHNGTIATEIRSPLNFTSQFFFYEGTDYQGKITRTGAGLQFDFNDYIIFDVGSPEKRTIISPTGLETAGFLKSSDLGFTTTNSSQLKPVFADKDGKLVIDNVTTHYQSYPSNAAQPFNWDDQIVRNGIETHFQTSDAPKSLFVPINLPDGVKVTNVRMFLVDNSTSNLRFTFFVKDHLVNAIASSASAQSSTNHSSIFSINDNAQLIINNSQESYFVRISSVGNWTSTTLEFHSLVISYQYQ